MIKIKDKKLVIIKKMLIVLVYIFPLYDVSRETIKELGG